MEKNMHEVALSEIGPHLNQFITMIEKGEKVTLTKGGVPVATISPIKYDHSQEVKEAVREIAALRKKCRIDFQTYKELRDEGRK